MADDLPPCGWTVTPVCNTDEWDTYSTEVKDAATEWATAILWSATGRRFGLCSVTVRPCRRDCEDCPTGWYWSYGQWVPYIAGGVWRNCWCGFGPGCGSCNASCQAWLPGPVESVTEVVLNGAIVDPNTYRLDKADGAYWLVRNRPDETSDDCWPDCQNFDHTTGEDDTWYVTYDKGLPVPASLTTAAGTLALEWARGCVGATCRLPGRLQNLTRQGISVSMVPLDQLYKYNLTGLPEVDQIIVALNPNGIKGRPRISSVELSKRVRYPT